MNIITNVDNDPIILNFESRGEFLRINPIQIEFKSIGCVMNVGKKSIAFSTIKECIDALNEYIEDPESSMELWENKSNLGK